MPVRKPSHLQSCQAPPIATLVLLVAIAAAPGSSVVMSKSKAAKSSATARQIATISESSPALQVVGLLSCSSEQMRSSGADRAGSKGCSVCQLQRKTSSTTSMQDPAAGLAFSHAMLPRIGAPCCACVVGTHYLRHACHAVKGCRHCTCVLVALRADSLHLLQKVLTAAC